MLAGRAARRRQELAAAIQAASRLLPAGQDLAGLYRPVPRLAGLLGEEGEGELCQAFWAAVPPAASPDRATLDSDIAPDALLQGEAVRQAKLRRKLEQKVRCGTMEREEMERRLGTLGRPEGGQARPSFPLLSSDRGLRKRQQVESIVSVLHLAASDHKLVVDFGSGSGNLSLALAAWHPGTTFLLADRNLLSLELAAGRAVQAGLANVVTKQFSFAWDTLAVFQQEVEREQGRAWDLGIGLHCCGAFTDLVLEACRRAGADCLAVPCCNGKLHQTAGDGLSFPRSAVLAGVLTPEQYWQLSRAADDSSHYAAKCLVEWDRALGQRESGAAVALLRMEPAAATPKHHVLYCARGGRPGYPPPAHTQ
jgi:hypothetical protein